jgi:ATP-dependent Lhr-like helicase
MIPSYEGGKFPLSTHLAMRVRRMLADTRAWGVLPEAVGEWLSMQAERSTVPDASEVLVETFPRGSRHFLVVFPFEGRLAHQTLGMLLTRRLHRLGARPVGFVANDYALAVWGMADMAELERSGRLEVAGLIERRHPGKTKSGRQVTISSDLIYDVLRKHDPRHILLEAAWADAATGLLDIGRLGDFLRRIKGRILYQAVSHVTPLAVPVLLEIGQELVYGGGVAEAILREAASDLVREAMQPRP